MKLKIITLFIGLFSAFRGEYGNKCGNKNGNNMEMLQNMLDMIQSRQNPEHYNKKNQYDDDKMLKNDDYNYDNPEYDSSKMGIPQNMLDMIQSRQNPGYDSSKTKKNQYDIHRMLKNDDPNYSMSYKMFKIQMLQMRKDLKIKDNKKYKKIKASIRMYLLKISATMCANCSNYANSGEQQPNLNTYETAPQFNWKSAPHFNYWSALRYQQYLISLKHTYDQYVANLNNAQHMRMLESHLKLMQAKSNI